MGTVVKFLSEKYGNYNDTYYVKDYTAFISTLQQRVVESLTQDVNLGVVDGVIIENNFKGDFSTINCAIVESNHYGTHLYKIIKRVFIRRNLWRLTMVKDMVSAKYENILDSKVLASRLGMDRTIYNPLLFMEEEMTLSEIKKNQVNLGELSDKSYGMLMFFNRDALDGTENGKIVWESDIDVNDIGYDEEYTNVSEVPYLGYNILNESVGFRVTSNNLIYKNNAWSVYRYNSTVSKTMGVLQKTFIELTSGNTSLQLTPKLDYPNNGIVMPRDNTIMSQFQDILSLGVPHGEVQGQLGKRIKIGSTIYEIKSRNGREITSPNRNLTYGELTTIWGDDYTIDGGVANAYSYLSNISYVEVELYLDPIGALGSITKELGQYKTSLEQPFKILYVPIIEGKPYKYDGDTYRLDVNIMIQLVYDLISKYSGDAGKLLDVQITPYCPIPNLMTEAGAVEFNIDNTNPTDVLIIDDIIVPIYNVMKADGQLVTSMTINVEDYKQEMKKKYVLTSPSGATSYEFSIAKNDGLTGFIHKYNLRPFSSFYQVQPLFKGLYGTNYKDTRGLIWQEDMSMTMISNAWETYKRQNVNYLTSFNQGQSYQRSELTIHQETNWGNYGFDAGKRMINATIDAGAAASEAVANDLIGIKGAISGGTQAGVIMGGAIATEAIEASQLAYNNRQDTKLLENQLSVARTQFNYGIGNIKAIPENIDKVSGIFATNNFVAYMQVFEPSDKEKIYYNDYLDTYGCNVGMMVNLREQQFGYLQGTIIQFGGVITNEEYNELVYQLQRGVREYKE